MHLQLDTIAILGLPSLADISHRMRSLSGGSIAPSTERRAVKANSAKCTTSYLQGFQDAGEPLFNWIENAILQG